MLSGRVGEIQQDGCNNKLCSFHGPADPARYTSHENLAEFISEATYAYNRSVYIRGPCLTSIHHSLPYLLYSSSPLLGSLSLIVYSLDYST